ncbi:ATP-dependent DNA ligase [Candidatus Bathyarchaeota archaeon]|nr:ATP-dependent DNA ligase [Candidatus Bathyarchaeota archaeon]NIR14023.1 ATP-dependent DNA ligase [Desulfobacterales bacterium]NIU80648.1 ATP-dependent DNA ligase [Candidatus Bathyarchaeota archaeon]NIV67266.1 ATP-dependent DNA ligase [Candidatus Bathyarchaeota archaeon]NIW15834.1 ATP-dependent DNA ligase [Candidatus Bathyarchaeota archaeon]
MKYSSIAESYGKIEATTKRLEMTDHLVELLKRTPREVIDKVVYLTQGKLYPDFVGIEIGIAEKLAMRAVAKATGYSQKGIEEDLKQTGDLGSTTQRFLEKRAQMALSREPLTARKVYDQLEKMARASGPGSMDQKVSLLAGLLTNASPEEGKYIVRTVTGNLRLGIAHMTVLDALAIAYGGGKESREELERAYNISSDLGRVARTVVEEGMEGLRKFKVSVGRPIRPMLAERLSSPEEILEKMGGECIAEFKYDGERMQAHKSGDDVLLFSRRLEDITGQYPDGKELLRRSVRAEEAIIEAECVAVDPDSGEMRAFQELMHRRRKYGIEEAMEEYPVALFIFDALYVDGEDLTLEPYPVRHELLEELIRETDRVTVARYLVTQDPEELESFFERAIESGCEGLICKSMAEDAVYQAGARGWLWIKYKRDYKSEMTDTVDLAVVGAFHGRGKRAGTYGALLLAAYDSEEDMFKTVTRCGTGFTDEDLEKLPDMMERHRIADNHPRVHSTIEADIWFEPAVVLEVIGAEITLSPTHTCAMNKVRKGGGLAIRFPRFTGKYRLDKSAEDSTTVNEIVEMYHKQMKKLKD